MKNYLQKGEAIYVPAPSPGIVSGQCAMVGAGIFGVFAEDAATGVTVALWVKGIYSLPKVSAQAWALGDALFWDPVAARVTNAPGSLQRIGFATAIAANPSSTGNVLLIPVSDAAGSKFLIESVTTGITAHAGGGKASATPLTTQRNYVSVCATTADSVLLPPSAVGLEVEVFNAGAAAAQVFGAGSDTIDGVATGTGVPLTNAKRAVYTCFTLGAWISAQLGVISA